MLCEVQLENYEISSSFCSICDDGNFNFPWEGNLNSVVRWSLKIAQDVIKHGIVLLDQMYILVFLSDLTLWPLGNLNEILDM